MPGTDLRKLVTKIKDDGESFVVVRPGIVASFYVTTPFRTFAPKLAETVEAFLEFVGRGVLTSYMAEDGTRKPLTEKRLARDLGILRNPPKSADGLDWEYSSEPNGGAGELALFMAAADVDDDFPEQTSLIRLEFGENAVDELGDKVLRSFLVDQANVLGAQSGNVGLGFKYAEPFTDEAIPKVNALLPRYLAFDPCFNDAADLMRDRTYTAHWLNFLDKSMFRKCGGEKALASAAPGAKADTVGSTVVIQSSRVPAVGDRNRKSPDLGNMPGVARFLKPLRLPLDGLGDDEFDVEAWLARFDDLPNQAWNNR